jgi:hypothetical protein
MFTKAGTADRQQQPPRPLVFFDHQAEDPFTQLRVRHQIGVEAGQGDSSCQSNNVPQKRDYSRLVRGSRHGEKRQRRQELPSLRTDRSEERRLAAAAGSGGNRVQTAGAAVVPASPC